MDLSGVTLQKLRLFVLVFEQGSFNQAAQEMAMSQSAVSQHIKGLEQALGVSLLIRSPQGVRPSAMGELVYTHAVQILQTLEKLGETVNQRQLQERQQLSLGATSGVSHYLLPSWIRRFQQAQPNVRFSVETGFVKDIVQGVIDRRYAFGLTVGELNVPAAALVTGQVIRQVEYLVVVPATHHWIGQTTVTAEQLMAAPFLNRRPTSHVRLWLESYLEPAIILNTVAEFDSPSTIIQAVLSDLGVSILPEYVIKDEVDRGEIVPLRIEAMRLIRPFQLFWKKEQPLNALQNAFLTYAIV